jgi:hypothetical protein
MPGHPRDPEGLPRQRRGITPQMLGRYPDYDVLEHAAEWDAVTRDVVLARVHDVPELRFFTPGEARCLRVFCDVVMAQEDEPRIPVLEMVDEKLHAGRLDGFQHADMPDDRDTWRAVAAELEREGLPDADDEGRRVIVDRFSKGELTWESVDCGKAFGVVMRAVLSAFYSHPWAWNEIGFGGPAYPRGYMRLAAGRPEPDEGREAFDLDPVPDVRRRGID